MRVLMLSFTLLLLTLVRWPATPLFAQQPTATPTARHSTVYLPVVSSEGSPASANEQGNAIYGLVGRIQKAAGQSFSNYLVTSNNTQYALVGSSTTVEQRIGDLRDRQPPIYVKIWGNIYTVGANVPLIVVNDLLPGDPAPTPTPVVQPTIRVKFDLVNLYAGPGQQLAQLGQVRLNQVCDLIGRNSTNTWWEVRCANNLSGWVEGNLVQTNGDAKSAPLADTVTIPTPTPIATATPAPATPTPAPLPSSAWRATYFNNTQLAGNPVAIADVAVLNLNWGTNKPDPAITADNFSARFERVIYFNPGFYRFILAADDGARVWLDGALLFNEWHGSTDQIYAIGRALSGAHTLRVEYYEVGGQANLRFTYTLINNAPVWTASYFAGASLAGAPLLSQQEPRSAFALDYNWGATSPSLSMIPADNWSARWVGQFPFEAGNYIFRANADDGVRVYINDQLIIDDWQDGYHEDSNRFVGIGADTHTIRIEYYARTGSARLRVWWSREIGAPIGPQ
ncbi:MAG: PA14 domain-containing protein [Caldilineaceae bacterium]